MNDRELLELAAKSRGMIFSRGHWGYPGLHYLEGAPWNPLTDDGDAFRLAVAFKMQTVIHADWVEILVNGVQYSNCCSSYASDGCMLETTRRAIVRAAAATVSRGAES